MFRSDEEMAVRDAKSLEVKRAFERAQVGVIHQRNPGMPHCSVIAYLNYGFGGQRQVTVTIEDDGDCRVFMSKLYQVPEGKTGGDIDLGPVPLLFTLPGTTPEVGEAIVRRVREASVQDSESVPVKLFEPPEPPVLVSSLQSLGDLIDAYQQHYFCKAYSDLLIEVLKRVGKVNHRGEEWCVESGGHVSHSVSAPGSKPVFAPDGQPVIYTNAAHIRLAPFLDDRRV
jgi:hypothetical protein